MFSPGEGWSENPDLPSARRARPGRHEKPGVVQFAFDVSTAAKMRLETLHERLGFPSKAQTFEAILYRVAALERIERKLDAVLGVLEGRRGKFAWKKLGRAKNFRTGVRENPGQKPRKS